MRRRYNSKISEKANESLNRRESVVRAQKRLIAIVIILVVSLGILLGTGIKALASSGESQKLHKYYKSICIKEGDTLWDIAGEYVQNTDVERQEYIDEICELNSIYENEIHAGDFIIVSYFSNELK